MDATKRNNRLRCELDSRILFEDKIEEMLWLWKEGREREWDRRIGGRQEREVVVYCLPTTGVSIVQSDVRTANELQSAPAGTFPIESNDCDKQLSVRFREMLLRTSG